MWQLLLKSISFNFYGLFICLGIFLGYFLAKKRLLRFNLKEKDFETFLIFLIPVSIIGARIYHLLSWFSYYKLFPGEIFAIWKGGLGIYGAIIFGFLTIFIYSRAKKINLLKLLDFLAPSILLCQAIGRWGNFFNQEAFGPPTDLPWKFYVAPDLRPINFLNNSYFHPTFFYESLLCIIFLILLLYLEKKLKPKTGFSTGFYFLSYGLIRFFTEFLRFDTWQIQGIKVAQVISVAFIFIGIYLIRNGIIGKKLVK